MIIFIRNKWPKPIWPRDDHVGLPEKFQQFLLTGQWALLDPYQVQFSSVQFSRSIVSDTLRPHESHMPGLPIHYQLPEFTQTRAHWVSDAIQPSRPLSSPSSPAPNPSQHQGLFQWVKSSHEVARVLEFQLQPQSFQWTPRSMSQFKRVSQRSPDIHTRVSKQAGATRSFGSSLSASADINQHLTGMDWRGLADIQQDYTGNIWVISGKRMWKDPGQRGPRPLESNQKNLKVPHSTNTASWFLCCCFLIASFSFCLLQKDRKIQSTKYISNLWSTLSWTAIFKHVNTYK